MKNRMLVFPGAMLATEQSVLAYDFSDVASCGQTLYYNIVNDNAQVTRQNDDFPYYTEHPTGALSIPGSVSYGGTTYTVISIGDGAFYGCTGLTSVSIPDGVTAIGTARKVVVPR